MRDIAKKALPKLARGWYSNYVIQAMIVYMTPEDLEDFIGEFPMDLWKKLSFHAQGCRIVQRIIERDDCNSSGMLRDALAEDDKLCRKMSNDSMGRYVLEAILDSYNIDDGEDSKMKRARLLRCRELAGAKKHR